LRTEVTCPEVTLNADKDRLCQVLINLLSNAIKFSPENGTITVAAQIWGTRDRLEVSVTDQGRGIPDDLRQKIFDRFVQVEKSDETIRGGSGLGLAISKAIIEQHSGVIGVESELRL
jgi:signal transduction histidine kinase